MTVLLPGFPGEEERQESGVLVVMSEKQKQLCKLEGENHERGLEKAKAQLHRKQL